MGVEKGSVTTSPAMLDMSMLEAAKTTDAVCVQLSPAHVRGNNVEEKSMQQVAESEAEDEEECRRRTSIPPSFVYGSDAIAPRSVSERRWRSFDCYSNSSCSSASKSSTLAALDARIRQVGEELAKQTAQRDVRKRDRLQALLSSTKRDRVDLKRMQHLAHVAATQRSLTLLNDLKTIVLTLDEEDMNSPAPSEADSMSDCQSARLSMASSVSAIDETGSAISVPSADADQVLAEDVMHEVLVRQAKWLRHLSTLYKEKSDASVGALARRTSSSSSVAMQQFLSEFIQNDNAQRVPCCFDVPTRALSRFEKLVSRHQLLKPHLRKALNQLCLGAMASVASSCTEVSKEMAALFQDQEPKDVMRSLVQEITDSIAKEAWIPETQLRILVAFVEQMVFGRLSCAYLRPIATEIDEQNMKWREQVAKCRNIGLHEVGLPKDVIPDQVLAAARNSLVGEDGDVKGVIGASEFFTKSIAAVEQIPLLVPSCVLAAFMNAIRVLHEEAIELLHLPNGCVSADVLLPIMVYVLSRARLPHLFAQVHMMEAYAIGTLCDGSEPAYYVACLQAAIGYITTGEFENATED